MKHILVATALAFGASAFAEGAATKPAATGKMTNKVARAECLKENKELKGKKLAECVSGKMATSKQ